MEGQRPPDMSRRDFLKKVGKVAGFVGAGTVIGKLGDDVLEALAERGAKEVEPPESPQDTSQEKEDYELVGRNEFFDGNPEYLQVMTDQNGEWTQEQRKQRRKTLANGEVIFEDVGIDFYLVKRGDTISEIRERLSKYSEYAYLADQRYKLDSFNIPARKLRADMWIPIPVEAKDRKLTDAQFVAYANDAIDEMKENPEYGGDVEEILKKVSQRELVATMIAIAKQEGGGLPLGQFALHRYEAHHSAFSYSYFHVLMKGPGLTARRKLNLTEGQLYHPTNAVKLFLAFMVEKSGETRQNVDRLFPVGENQEDFAVFYNGKRWKKTNPYYLQKLQAYYDVADRRLSNDGTRWKKE